MESYNKMIEKVITQKHEEEEYIFYVKNEQAKAWLTWLKSQEEFIKNNHKEIAGFHTKFFTLKQTFDTFTKQTVFHENENIFNQRSTTLIAHTTEINLALMSNQGEIANLIKQYVKVIELLVRYELWQTLIEKYNHTKDRQLLNDLARNARAMFIISNIFITNPIFKLSREVLSDIFIPLLKGCIEEKTSIDEIKEDSLFIHYRKEWQAFIESNGEEIKKSLANKMKNESSSQNQANEKLAAKKETSLKDFEFVIDGISQVNLAEQSLKAIKKSEDIIPFMTEVRIAFAHIYSSNYLNLLSDERNQKRNLTNLTKEFVKYITLMNDFDEIYCKPVELILTNETKNKLKRESISLFTMLELVNELQLTEEIIKLIKEEFYNLAIKFLQIYFMIGNIITEHAKFRYKHDIEKYAKPTYLLSLLKKVISYYRESDIKDDVTLEYDHWHCRIITENGSQRMSYTDKQQLTGFRFRTKLEEQIAIIEEEIKKDELAEDEWKALTAKAAEEDKKKLQEKIERVELAELELYELLAAEEKKRKEPYEIAKKKYLLSQQSREKTKNNVNTNQENKTKKISQRTNMHTLHKPKKTYTPKVFYVNRKIDNIYHEFDQSQFNQKAMIHFRENAFVETNNVLANNSQDYDYLRHCYGTRTEAELTFIKNATSKNTAIDVNYCLERIKEFMNIAIKYCPDWEKQQQEVIEKTYPEEFHKELCKQLHDEITAFLNWCDYTLDEGIKSLVKHQEVIKKREIELVNTVNTLTKENQQSLAARDKKREDNKLKAERGEKILQPIINYQCPYESKRQENFQQIKKLKGEIKQCSKENKFVKKLHTDFSPIKENFAKIIQQTKEHINQQKVQVNLKMQPG